MVDDRLLLVSMSLPKVEFPLGVRAGRFGVDADCQTKD